MLKKAQSFFYTGLAFLFIIIVVSSVVWAEFYIAKLHIRMIANPKEAAVIATLNLAIVISLVLLYRKLKRWLSKDS